MSSADAEAPVPTDEHPPPRDCKKGNIVLVSKGTPLVNPQNMIREKVTMPTEAVGVCECGPNIMGEVEVRLARAIDLGEPFGKHLVLKVDQKHTGCLQPAAFAAVVAWRLKGLGFLLCVWLLPILGIAAALTLGSLAAWEAGSDSLGFPLSLGLLIGVPLLLSCVICGLRCKLSDGECSSMGTISMLFVAYVGIFVTPLASVLYITGPAATTLATLHNGGRADNVQVVAPATPAAEVSLSFADGVFVASAYAGVRVLASSNPSRRPDEYYCVAPLATFASIESDEAVQYWAVTTGGCCSSQPHPSCWDPVTSERGRLAWGALYGLANMGTHYYNPSFGRIEYGRYAADAKAAALARSNATLIDADASVFVLVQSALEGPGSMTDALREKYTHGLFWSVAAGGFAFLGMFAFYVVIVTGNARLPCAIYGDLQVCRPIMCVWNV